LVASASTLFPDQLGKRLNRHGTGLPLHKIGADDNLDLLWHAARPIPTAAAAPVPYRALAPTTSDLA